MNSKKVAKHHPSIINIEEDQTLSSANWYIPKDGNIGNLAYYLFQLLVEDSYNGNIIDNYDSITEEAKETIDMQTKAGFVKPESN